RSIGVFESGERVSGFSRGGLEGTWVPVAADVAGKPLVVGELRVKYLVFDSGNYMVNETASPATMDIVGRDGPNAGRTMLAIYQLVGDNLTVCYDLDSKDRPTDMLPKQDQLLLSITYARALTALS